MGGHGLGGHPGKGDTPTPDLIEGNSYRERYSAYINSKRWERRRLAYFSKYSRVCRACGSKEKIHLHHHTYVRMGYEMDEDLVPLCESCHSLLHQYHRDHPGMTLTRATNDFLRHHGARLRPKKKSPSQPPKQKRPKPVPAHRRFEVGDEVIVVGKSLALSWAKNKRAVVREVVDSSLWRVEVEGHPGSRLAVTTMTIAHVAGRGKDPVNSALGSIRERRRRS